MQVWGTTITVLVAMTMVRIVGWLWGLLEAMLRKKRTRVKGAKVNYIWGRERMQNAWIKQRVHERIWKVFGTIRNDASLTHPRPSYPSARCSSAELASVSPDNPSLTR